jgi:hypothetical protein
MPASCVRLRGRRVDRVGAKETLVCGAEKVAEVEAQAV